MTDQYESLVVSLVAFVAVFALDCAGNNSDESAVAVDTETYVKHLREQPALTKLFSTAGRGYYAALAFGVNALLVYALLSYVEAMKAASLHHEVTGGRGSMAASLFFYLLVGKYLAQRLMRLAVTQQRALTSGLCALMYAALVILSLLLTGALSGLRLLGAAALLPASTWFSVHLIWASLFYKYLNGGGGAGDLPVNVSAIDLAEPTATPKPKENGSSSPTLMTPYGMELL